MQVGQILGLIEIFVLSSAHFPFFLLGLGYCGPCIANPSAQPTLVPSSLPTDLPSSVPTVTGTQAPSSLPTAAPTNQQPVTAAPTSSPTAMPTSASPTASPTEAEVEGCEPEISCDAAAGVSGVVFCFLGATETENVEVCLPVSAVVM